MSGSIHLSGLGGLVSFPVDLSVDRDEAGRPTEDSESEKAGEVVMEEPEFDSETSLRWSEMCPKTAMPQKTSRRRATHLLCRTWHEA